jgi:hypothetical protein
MTSEIEELITAAKTACEEMRAEIGYGGADDAPGSIEPSWLTELERAVEASEEALAHYYA